MQHQQTQSAAWYKSIKQRSAGIPKGGEGALQLLFALSLLTVCTSRCPFQPDTFSGLPWFCDTDTRNLLCLLLAMPNCMLSLCLKEGTAFPDNFAPGRTKQNLQLFLNCSFPWWMPLEISRTLIFLHSYWNSLPSRCLLSSPGVLLAPNMPRTAQS